MLGIFVHRPLLYMGFAGAFALLLLLTRLTAFGSGKSLRPLWIAAAAWALSGLWEYVVMTRTPEANIRVDLLVLLPALGMISVWALYRLLR